MPGHAGLPAGPESLQHGAAKHGWSWRLDCIAKTLFRFISSPAELGPGRLLPAKTNPRRLQNGKKWNRYLDLTPRLNVHRIMETTHLESRIKRQQVLPSRTGLRAALFPTGFPANKETLPRLVQLHVLAASPVGWAYTQHLIHLRPTRTGPGLSTTPFTSVFFTSEPLHTRPRKRDAARTMPTAQFCSMPAANYCC